MLTHTYKDDEAPGEDDLYTIKYKLNVRFNVTSSGTARRIRGFMGGVVGNYLPAPAA